MALDLHLPSETFLIISLGSCEFRNKSGIVDMLSEHPGSSQSRISEMFSDAASIAKSVIMSEKMKDGSSKTQKKSVRKL